jgi:hypothetical protein
MAAVYDNHCSEAMALIPFRQPLRRRPSREPEGLPLATRNSFDLLLRLPVEQ